jgi:hypothetical protein
MLVLMHHNKITQLHELVRSTKPPTRIKVKWKIHSPAATNYSCLNSGEICHSEWDRRVRNCLHKPYYISIVIHVNCVHFLKFFRFNTNLEGQIFFFHSLTFSMWNTNFRDSLELCQLPGFSYVEY